MEEIRDKIKTHIYSKLSDPDMLFSEHQLAASFGLKRSNVREILLGLEGEGVVLRMPQRGYKCVNYLDTERAVVRKIRYNVEYEAVRQAIEKAGTEDYVRLGIYIEDMEDAVRKNDVFKYMDADMNFHVALVHASNDNFLIKLFSFMLSTVFQIHKCLDHDILMEESLNTHKNIYNNLRKRDWAETEKYINIHLR